MLQVKYLESFMFSFLFNEKLNRDYLKLAQIVYGGELFYRLKNFRLKEIELLNSDFVRVNDSLLKKIGNKSFYSYKNNDSGFVATLFENPRSSEIVIAYRGTERIGLGENASDLIALTKDINTDLNIMLGELDKQFDDAYEFYKLVKEQNPNKKIVIVGQSLGGALAQIVAAKVYCVYKQKVKTYSYNAPGCKHLLEPLGCDITCNYSFIKNYVVMNDWCGMFGEKIGQTYLIPPILPKILDNPSLLESFENMLLSTHEGIFKYSGTVIKKPKNFNQPEGLALWLYDKNNPIKDFEKPSDFIAKAFPSFKITQFETVSKSIQDKFDDFFEDKNDKVKQFASNLQEATMNFIEEQSDKISDVLSNTTVSQFAETLDNVFSEINEESLCNAIKVLKKLNWYKKVSKNFENS